MTKSEIEKKIMGLRAQARRIYAREILDVLAYLLDGAIEREDDGGFVTVTILKQKFDVLKKDYERILDGEERA